MIKIHEFYAKHEDEIKEKLKSVTQENKKESIYFVICVIMPLCLLGVVSVLQYIMNIFKFDKFNINFISIFLIFIWLILNVVYIIHYLLEEKQYRYKIIKEEIFTKFIQECFEKTINYDCYGGFSKSELKKILKILPYFTYEYDLIKNNKRGLFQINLNESDIKFGDIKYLVNKRNKNGDLIVWRGNTWEMNGVLIKINVTNKNNVEVAIKNSKWYYSKYEYDDIPDYTYVHSENINLEDREELVNFLMDIYNKYKIKCKLLIQGDETYIFLDDLQIIDSNWEVKLDEKGLEEIKNKYDQTIEICQEIQQLSQKILLKR